MTSRRRPPMPLPASLLGTVAAPGGERYHPRDRVYYTTPESEQAEREQAANVARVQSSDPTLST